MPNRMPQFIAMEYEYVGQMTCPICDQEGADVLMMHHRPPPPGFGTIGEVAAKVGVEMWEGVPSTMTACVTCLVEVAFHLGEESKELRGLGYMMDAIGRLKGDDDG